MKAKKAVIYTRVSSTGNRQDTARQVDDLTAYANANGLTIEKVFKEKMSGYKSTSERTELSKCLALCFADPTGTILLLSELTRLGRSTDDILRNIMAAKEAGLNIFFLKEQFSIFTPDGKPHPFLMIFISVLATCAELEGQAIAYRLASGRERYVREGGKLGRKEGYRKSLAEYQEQYKEVFKYLRRRNRPSFADIAKLTGVSKRTIFTLAHMLDEQQPAT